MSRDSNSSYEISLADLAQDEAEILRLWTLGFPEVDMLKEKYNWYYLAVQPCAPKVYLLKKDQALIGVLGIGVRSGVSGSESFKAGSLVDLAVDPAYRTLGPALTFIKKASAQAFQSLDCLYGFPNERSLIVYKRAGFNTQLRITRYVYLLRHSSYLKKHSRLAADLFQFFLEGIVATYSRLRTVSLRTSYDCRVSNDLADDVDKLWERVAGSKHTMIRRNADFLKWRFEHHSSWQFKYFWLRDKASGVLLGYVVFSTFPSGEVNVVDFLTIDNESTLTILLRLFCQRMRTDGFDSISLEFFGRSDAVDAILQSGFIDRDSQPIVMKTKEGDSTQGQGDDWYITAADRD